MTLEIFDNGNESYLTWMAKHPDGFVLNRQRIGISKNYLVAHAYGCERISAYNDMSKPGGFTTRGYIKVCSTILPELREYARNRCGRPDGSFSKKCKQCNPNIGAPNASTAQRSIEEAGEISAPCAPSKSARKRSMNKETIIAAQTDSAPFTEGRVENYLQPWLEANGYSVEKRVRVANGIIDLVASDSSRRWIVEAKGEDKGGYNSAEMNFRIGISQICSRMDIAEYGTIYGLAIPMAKHFVKVLKKHRNFSVFEKMDIFLLVASDDGAIALVPPGDVQSYVEQLIS